MAEQVKRKRGRPRKNPLPEEVNTLVQETISKQKAPPKQEIKEEIPEIKKEIPKKEMHFFQAISNVPNSLVVPITN